MKLVKVKNYETDYNFFTFLKVDSSCRESCALAFFKDPDNKGLIS